MCGTRDGNRGDDERERRCPRLGHDVPLRYCRMQEGEHVCSRILNCWWERFDIVSYLRRHLSASDVASLRQAPSPPPRLTTILTAVEAARERTATGTTAADHSPASGSSAKGTADE